MSSNTSSSPNQPPDLTPLSSSAGTSSPRFGYWVTFFIVSTITLGATIEAQAHTDRLSLGAQTNQSYAVACASLLFIISTGIVVLHTRPLLSTLILGTKIEGIVIFVIITFWTAFVAIVSDTRHGLATDVTGSISNGNLYYFSWAGLATAVVLMTSYLRSVFGVDVTEELRARASRLQYWVWAGVLGLIQMGSSARIFDNHCGSVSVLTGALETVTFCKRCKLGITLGIVTTVASIVVVTVKLGTSLNNKAPWIFTGEMLLSGMLVGSQAVGVAFLTSNEGPGAPLNNLYYSSWGVFGLSFILVASCVDDFTAARGVFRNGGNSGLGEEGEGLELR